MKIHIAPRGIEIVVAVFHVVLGVSVIVLLLHDSFSLVLGLLLIDVAIHAAGVFRCEIPMFRLDLAMNTILNDRAIAKERLDSLSRRSRRLARVQEIVNACCEQTTRQVYTGRAEYAALQSQINPHFLYNTLDSIRAQAIIDGAVEVAEMIEALARFFRYCVGREGELVTLREELANVENYMAIYRYRFDDRYKLAIHISEADERAYDALIPRLIVQPIVENAVYHGLKDVQKDGRIDITITLFGSDMLISISDNGCGIDEDRLIAINMRLRSERSTSAIDSETSDLNVGVALSNIEKRVQMLFGNQYGICVYSTPHAGTDVEVYVPVHAGTDRQYEVRAGQSTGDR